MFILVASIAEALDKGAEIVLAGRVSDPGLVLGPAVEFGWIEENINRLASGTLAGHILNVEHNVRAETTPNGGMYQI